MTLKWLRLVCPQQLNDLRDRDAVKISYLQTLQVAQHFSDGLLALLLKFAEERGGIAPPLLQPFRAIDEPNWLSIAFH